VQESELGEQVLVSELGEQVQVLGPVEQVQVLVLGPVELLGELRRPVADQRAGGPLEPSSGMRGPGSAQVLGPEHVLDQVGWEGARTGPKSRPWGPRLSWELRAAPGTGRRPPSCWGGRPSGKGSLSAKYREDASCSLMLETVQKRTCLAIDAV